jgi:hypothetical protein
VGVCLSSNLSACPKPLDGVQLNLIAAGANEITLSFRPQHFVILGQYEL